MSWKTYVVVTLLLIITLVNFIDRTAISYAIDLLQDEYHLSAKQQGLILGVFAIGYLISTLTSGLLIDTYGPKRVLAIALFVWSFAIGGMFFAGGTISFYLLRTILGLAEGPNFPSLGRAINNWLPIHRRVQALAFCLLAVPIALTISGPLITHLIYYFGWRGMFLCLGCCGFILFPVWCFYFSDYPNNISTVSPASSFKKHGTIYLSLLRSPTFLANCWAFFVYGYFMFFFMSWLPAYFQKTYHMELTNVGWFVTIPWLLGSISMWLMARFSDRILQKTANYRLSRTYLIIGSHLLGGIFLIPLLFHPDYFTALIFISISLASISGSNAMYSAVNIDIAGNYSATAIGIACACYAAAGFLAPVITGLLIDITGQFDICYFLMMCLASSSIILLLLYHKPDACRNFQND